MAKGETAMKVLFNIPDNDMVADLKDKYSYCLEQYATCEDEAKAFKIISELDDYERLIYFAVCEYKSSRKVADVFETNNNYASKAIKEIKNIINNLKG